MSESRIIICPDCKGSGKSECNELDDPHHNDYWEWDEICTECGGEGRIMQTVNITTRKLTKKELALRPQAEECKKAIADRKRRGLL
jgi:DnaJ-class molecular chaperone